MTESQNFDPDPTSVRKARDFVEKMVAGAGWSTYDATLVVSELATNVVRHARTHFTVTVNNRDGVVEIEVSDGSSILPAMRDLASGSGGYGLKIVEEVAEEWGVEQVDEGKRVWVRMRALAADDQDS